MRKRDTMKERERESSVKRDKFPLNKQITTGNYSSPRDLCDESPNCIKK